MGRAQSDVVLVGGFMLALIASMGLAGTRAVQKLIAEIVEGLREDAPVVATLLVRRELH